MSAAQLGELASRFPHTASSLRLLRTALVHYWAMVGVDNPAKAIRPPKPPPYKYRGLEPDEADQLKRTATGWTPEGTTVLLGLFLALRRQEMANLRWECFDTDLTWVSITGKGAKTRHLPVHPDLVTHLRSRQATGYMFPGRGRPHVHTATIRYWIGKVSAHAGIGEVAPHQLRHTCLAEMNDQTEDLRVTQYFAGHADPETTSRYTRATERRLLAAVDALYRRAA